MRPARRKLDFPATRRAEDHHEPWWRLIGEPAQAVDGRDVYGLLQRNALIEQHAAWSNSLLNQLMIAPELGYRHAPWACLQSRRAQLPEKTTQAVPQSAARRRNACRPPAA